MEGTERDPLEWQESDIFWPSDAADPEPNSQLPTPIRSSPNPNRHARTRFEPSDSPLVQKKPAINPALAAISAARAIPQQVQRPSPERGSPPGSGRRMRRMSAPVAVPAWPKWAGGSKRVEDPEGHGGVEGRRWLEGRMVPPHEMAGGRSHGTVEFSVLEGAGRTLKGRDTRRVRNAVFKRTGFLD